LKEEGYSAARILRYYAGKATDVQGETSLHTPGFVNLTFRQPFGVCGAIIPWNTPIIAMVVKFAPCLIVGNTLVLKSSEKAPLTSLMFAKLIQEAGFPPGVINILSGFGPTCGAAIASHMEIRKLAFTGSARTGRAIKKAAAASNLKNVTLELGGKSPLIIFGDADLEKAVPAAAASILSLSGQMCVASSRVYVESSIAEQFTKLLVKEIDLKGRNPSGNNPLSAETVRGPQADKLQFDAILGFLKEAKEDGLQILTGGGRDGDIGYYIEPTVILNPDESSRVMREEIFGPVQCVSTFQSEEEVLNRANDTEYGLFASVYTRDIPRSLRVAKKFESGTVGVNVTSPMAALDLPFGGWKASGEGRELGSRPLEAWSELKTVFIAL
jgi:aldehyde dehydrogenase (NAD+)